MDFDKIKDVITKAKNENRTSLLDTEGQEILKAMELPVPGFIMVGTSKEVSTINLFSGDKAVVKVVCKDILHKTDVGGVAIVQNEKNAIKNAIEEMEKKFTNFTVTGYSINEFVVYDSSIGREIIIGYRTTADFGPVVSFAPGGIYAEFLAKSFKTDIAGAVFSHAMYDDASLDKAIDAVSISSILKGKLRNQKALINDDDIKSIIKKFLDVSLFLEELGVTEFEVNPFVVTRNTLVALDVLIKIGSRFDKAKKRPTAKIKSILEPKSCAIIGVSEKMNMGHIILNNLIHDGFDMQNLFIVKPNSNTIEGVPCFDSVALLPKKVDLFILAISASQAPQVITEIIENEKAETIIVIPGGLDEKKGTSELTDTMQISLMKSRKTKTEGPVINGGNCLGIRSVPGKYNTLFIPEYKLPMPKTSCAPVALVSQSGAFAISRFSRLPLLNPKYLITCGNQMDLTIGDYIEYLEHDSSITLFAVYVEGFKPYDGLTFLKAAKKITSSGRNLILYRAGRTTAGAKASASHTASIAGDYEVTRSLCEEAGIILADTFEDFDDLVKIFTLLDGKKVQSNRLGAISNAGCECVAIADNLCSFTLPEFTSKTNSELEEIFKNAKISDIVDIHNPIDLTPMANDEAYAATTKALLKCDTVDAVVVGNVPLSAALNTLPKNESIHSEDVTSSSAFPARMGALQKESDKPFVCVVDSGSLYNELVSKIEEYKIPCFRTAGRALKMLDIFVRYTKR